MVRSLLLASQKKREEALGRLQMLPPLLETRLSTRQPGSIKANWRPPPPSLPPIEKGSAYLPRPKAPSL